MTEMSSHRAFRVHHRTEFTIAGEQRWGQRHVGL